MFVVCSLLERSRNYRRKSGVNFVYNTKYGILVTCQLRIERRIRGEGTVEKMMCWRCRKRWWRRQQWPGNSSGALNTSGYYLWNIICPIHRRYNSQSIMFPSKSSTQPHTDPRKHTNILIRVNSTFFGCFFYYLFSVFFTSWHKVTFSRVLLRIFSTSSFNSQRIIAVSICYLV